MNDIPALPINHSLDACAIDLPVRTLPEAQTLTGPARVGQLALASFGEHGIGVWEIAPSVSTDIESDEVFVVLSGEAVVSFADGRPPLQLKAGSVGRFGAGTATTWTVTRTLRKLYIA